MMNSFSEHSQDFKESLITHNTHNTHNSTESSSSSSYSQHSFHSCFEWWFHHNELGIIYDEHFYDNAYCWCLGCCPECLVLRCPSHLKREKETRLLCICCSFIWG